MDVRTLQKPLKDGYRADPDSSRITLTASGVPTGVPVSCSIEVGRAIQAAEAHTGVGGPGGAACSGDLLLGALAACAQITCQMVAAAMEIPVRADRRSPWRATSTSRGRSAPAATFPVGFEEIRLRFDLEAPGVDEEQRCGRWPRRPSATASSCRPWSRRRGWRPTGPDGPGGARRADREQHGPEHQRDGDAGVLEEQRGHHRPGDARRAARSRPSSPSTAPCSRSPAAREMRAVVVANTSPEATARRASPTSRSQRSCGDGRPRAAPPPCPTSPASITRDLARSAPPRLPTSTPCDEGGQHADVGEQEPHLHRVVVEAALAEEGEGGLHADEGEGRDEREPHERAPARGSRAPGARRPSRGAGAGGRAGAQRLGQAAVGDQPGSPPPGPRPRRTAGARRRPRRARRGRGPA